MSSFPLAIHHCQPDRSGGRSCWPDYNFQWKYKKGKDSIADALTRLPEVAMALVLARLEC
jgi:hypothetical protein